MDLNLTSRETAFRDELQAWLRANLPANWKREYDALQTTEEHFAYLRAWQKKVNQGNWAGVSWPKEYGGRGATLMEYVIFLQEMAAAQAPPLANTLGLSLIGPTIITHGTEAQKRRYLPKILSADEIWCQGFSEPNAGSDVAALGTEAHLDGGHFIVNGQKIWTSYGWIGDYCALLVRTDPTAEKHKGLSYLLVDMHAPGVTVRPLRQMTGESEFNEVFFENVRVPREDCLGAVNDGWRVAISTLMHERAVLGASLTITYRRQFERLVELARTLQRNGKPAAQDPVMRQKLAQCYLEIEIMSLNQMRAISRVAQSGQPGPEGSIQKIFWSELNQRFQQVAAELLGPHAQLTHGGEYAIDDGQWAHGFLRTRGNTIEAGTSEIQRNIIGHFVLGLPRSY